MILHRSISLPLAGLLVTGVVFLSLLSVEPPIRGAEPSREEQIATLERQIAELTKKLQELRKTPTPSPGPTLALPADWTKALGWRCIGPASMGGRIVALAVYEADPTTYWVGTASGGLLKTINGGITFEHQFDREATVSIGDVAVAPSNRNIVWVGTGENNPRNSVSWGDGVYRSIDGGKTWQNRGLRRSFQIGRILIHPKNPDIVYVGALGRLYGPNEERGLYRTSDGGAHWTKILHVDDRTGVIDMVMHPTEPDTLLVATWERQRDGFDSHAGAIAARFNPNVKVDPPLPDGYDAYDPDRKWGKGAGIWKTTDGGKKFRRITAGLPRCAMGRIGLSWYRKDPRFVYAVIDSEKYGMGEVPGYLGIVSEDGPKAARIRQVTKGSPGEKAGLKAGDLIVAVDGKAVASGEALGQAVRIRKPGEKVSLNVVRDGKNRTIVVVLGERTPPGRRPTFGIAPEETPAGIRLNTVLANSPAARIDLRTGDILLSINGKKLTTVKELLALIRAIEPGQKVFIQYLRGKVRLQSEFTMPMSSIRRVTRPHAIFLGGQRENVQDIQGPDGQDFGGVYRSADGGETWVRINSVNSRPMYFSTIRVDPSDQNHLYLLGVRVYRSEDGGKTFKVGGDSGIHADQHALWIDPLDGRHLLIGTDGGTYVSRDRGQKWDFLDTMAIGQFYHCCVDSRRPYRVYGGMQDNGSWGGPSRALDGRGPRNADWFMVQGGDGFVCRVDPLDPDVVYTESQEGNMSRTNLRTGERKSIKPQSRGSQSPYRFNWNTPFILSSHNPRIVYSAGSVVFRSIARGDDPRPISPVLTQSDKASATAVAESPRNAEMLWAGTDDGNLWLTRDGGAKWENLIAKVGLPKRYCVATIEPSRFVDGRCYVCFDGHRSDNDDPHLFVTEDFGQTWKSIRANLPTGSSRCLREDLYNPDVLYLGTEFAVWASIDRGQSWTRINNNLPTVAVHELAQHPTAGEMVAATHGRSLWVLDVTPLRQLKPAMTKAATTLLAPGTAMRWRREPVRGTIYGAGHREYFGENPRTGADIYYALTRKVEKPRLVIQDYTGKTLATLKVKNEPGLHRATWDLRGSPPAAGGLGFFLPARFLSAVTRGPQPVPPGQYRVVLTADGKEHLQGLKVENDPALNERSSLAEDEPVKRTRPLEDD